MSATQTHGANKMKKVFLTENKTNTAKWYLDTDGDLHTNLKDASLNNPPAAEVITDQWYPGSFEDWKKSILKRYEG